MLPPRLRDAEFSARPQTEQLLADFAVSRPAAQHGKHSLRTQLGFEGLPNVAPPRGYQGDRRHLYPHRARFPKGSPELHCKRLFANPEKGRKNPSNTPSENGRRNLNIHTAASHFGLPLVKIDSLHIQNDGTMWHKWHGLAHNFSIESIKNGQSRMVPKASATAIVFTWKHRTGIPLLMKTSSMRLFDMLNHKKMINYA